MIASSTPQSTPQLIVRAKQGDPEAIGEIYETYRVRIFRFLFYRTGDAQTADDLTSEVFLRMIHSLSGYRTMDISFVSWLFRIARNLLADHYRKMNHRNHLDLEDERIAMSEPGQIQSVDAQLNSVVLQQALNRLNDDQRDVIVLRFVTGLPISDVAQALNKSEDAIKGLQRRGLASLRELLTEWEVRYV